MMGYTFRGLNSALLASQYSPLIVLQRTIDSCRAQYRAESDMFQGLRLVNLDDGAYNPSTARSPYNFSREFPSKSAKVPELESLFLRSADFANPLH